MVCKSGRCEVAYLGWGWAGERGQGEGTSGLQNGGIKAPSKSCDYFVLSLHAYRYPFPLSCVSLCFVFTGKFSSSCCCLLCSFLSWSLPYFNFPPFYYIFPLYSLHYLHYIMKKLASFAPLVLYSLSNAQKSLAS